MWQRILIFSLCSAAAFAQSGTATLKSPDGRLELTFRTGTKTESTAAGGALTYAVTFQGKPLLENSALKLELQGQSPLGPNVRILKATPSQKDETWKRVSGKRSTVRDHYNALNLELVDNGSTARLLNMEARAYDDAIAFRYVVPVQAGGLREFRLTKEATEFRIAKDATMWGMVLPNYRSMYESEFFKMSISSLSNQGGVPSNPLLGAPVLLDVPGVAWMAITEADLAGTAGMYLVNPSGNWAGHYFETRLPPSAGDPEIVVSGMLPHHSAWRVVLVGSEVGRLIESDAVLNLNPPSRIADTSWIKPGKASWDWWNGTIGRDGKSAYTTETMKYYVDFAAASGLEYMLVDAGWTARNSITEMNGRVDIPALCAYAKTKGVRVWIWVHWSGLDKQMEEAFPLYEKWGVAGVKLDFMSRDDQEMIGFYYRVAETAARSHVMVDYHGSTKPFGMERTWPNVMGYESVLGMEQSKAGARDNPESHVTLPFTRMLAGPMDYTPGAFENATKEGFVPRMVKPMVQGTRAHQLAMYVVFEAPFQMVSDHPAAYEGQPAFEFIKAAPAAWDDTKVLNGQPGEYITIARRHGADWFLGAMSNWTPRTLDLPLSFLGEGKWTAEIYADAADAATAPKNVAIEKKAVDRATTLKAVLAPGGGYAVRFHK